MFSYVKTTLEIPDSLYRRAKATAARRGQTMQAFVTSAVESKLSADAKSAVEKPWMKFAGVFEAESDKSIGMLKAIEEACERVDPEEWR
jgi:hypothetical protein